MGKQVLRTAMVTGSAQGIGAAIVTSLQSHGIRVIGVDKQPDSQADVFVQADLSEWSAIEGLRKYLVDIDILVNNAAVLVDKPVSEFTESEFALIHDVNLRAPFLLCRTAGPAMGGRGFGRIINVSSVGARTGGLSDSAVYSASKAGLVSMTKHFARIFGPGAVTCNAVLPGAIETPMAAAQFARDPALRESILQRIPLGRYGSSDDVAEAVSFLASDAAGFITGVSLDVNGGWIMV